MQVQSNLNCWSPEKFAEFCVFCGTDYKEPDTNIKKFGIKTAFTLMCTHSTARGVINWMAEQQKFQDRLPCKGSEYMSRFERIIAVFWHHVVFNPKRGECTSIASSFPLTAAYRVLEDLNLEEVCGVRFGREIALQVAKGELDPRSRQVKTLEPLSFAERRAIDFLLAEKRSEQMDYRVKVALEAEEAKRQAEVEQDHSLREIEQEEVNQVVEPSQKDAAQENQDRELRLLPGDLRKLMEIRNALKKNKVEESKPEPVENHKSKNPFAKKRVATPCHSRTPSVPIPMVKRARAVTPPSVPQTPLIPPEGQRLKDIAAHPRGGSGAKEAAYAVLIQRGFAPQLEDKEKAKLKYFFWFKEDRCPKARRKSGKQAGRLEATVMGGGRRRRKVHRGPQCAFNSKWQQRAMAKVVDLIFRAVLGLQSKPQKYYRYQPVDILGMGI